MAVAMVKESGIKLSEEPLNQIIDRIGKNDLKFFVIRHPLLLKNMTLPNLRDATAAFPSFVFHTQLSSVLVMGLNHL
ncbi:hypothetical protein RND71_004920 [Anisodus tanguticus]|uniref:Calcineurin B-like protein n=1 Tax=Anisodus tanguticus TaxID=243964 RepID=A0AAE1VL10_9SOLA|nr:hypothetical protein RND71_004920 [Anisodus tanguticus]